VGDGVMRVGFCLNGDGLVVSFSLFASDPVMGDNNGGKDVFVSQSGVTERVSMNSAGIEGNGFSDGPMRLSQDGGHVVFHSDAANLVPNDINGVWDVFVRGSVH